MNLKTYFGNALIRTDTIDINASDKIFYLSYVSDSKPSFELSVKDSTVHKSYTGANPIKLHVTDLSMTVDVPTTFDVTYQITVDGPAIIENVRFEDNAAANEFGFICGTDTRIVVQVSEHYDEVNKAELQIKDDNGEWRTIIPQITSNSTNYITYDDIKQYVNIGNEIQFRTKKKLLDDNYSYNTNATKLSYRPH